VVSLEPHLPDAHLNLGIALADQQQTEAALAEFSEASKLAPGGAAPHYNKGRVLGELRRYEEALPELQKAARLDPTVPDVWYRLGIAEREQQHYAEAVKALQQALKLAPRNADASYLLGQSYQNLDRMQDAIPAWKRALEADPNHSQALYSLFRALAKTDPEQSTQYQSRFTALQSQSGLTERARTLSNFAIAAAKAGKWNEAIAQLREAIQVCGSCSSLAMLHKNLGLTECQAGRFDDGEKDLRAALRDMPGDPEILKALELLEGIRTKPR
jgi:tetratricopeptide (TPR) repeat protein